MPRASNHGTKKSGEGRERIALRKRVGAYVRTRRQELSLSQGDVIRELGYVSRNSVSNIETGREGLPAKRIYAWADLLKVHRDGFFRFVTGESTKVDLDGAPGGAEASNGEGEVELLGLYRKLSPRAQKKLREQARELASSSGKEAPKKLRE